MAPKVAQPHLGMDDRNGYLTVNSEKTFFQEDQGIRIYYQGLFFDDMMHIFSCDKLKKEFSQLACLYASVALSNWQCCTLSWNTWKATRASR
jgi:hypothetical protein